MASSYGRASRSQRSPPPAAASSHVPAHEDGCDGQRRRRRQRSPSSLLGDAATKTRSRAGRGRPAPIGRDGAAPALKAGVGGARGSDGKRAAAVPLSMQEGSSRRSAWGRREISQGLGTCSTASGCAPRVLRAHCAGAAARPAPRERGARAETTAGSLCRGSLQRHSGVRRLRPAEWSAGRRASTESAGCSCTCCAATCCLCARRLRTPHERPSDVRRGARRALRWTRRRRASRLRRPRSLPPRQKPPKRAPQRRRRWAQRGRSGAAARRRAMHRA
jgi:hypothetical protein